jgi:hypothetical protein
MIRPKIASSTINISESLFSSGLTAIIAFLSVYVQLPSLNVPSQHRRLRILKRSLEPFRV